MKTRSITIGVEQLAEIMLHHKRVLHTKGLPFCVEELPSMRAADASREDAAQVSVERKRVLLRRKRKFRDRMVTHDDATMPDKKRAKRLEAATNHVQWAMEALRKAGEKLDRRKGDARRRPVRRDTRQKINRAQWIHFHRTISSHLFAPP